MMGFPWEKTSKEALVAALEEAEGDRFAAAKILGCHPDSVRRAMTRHGLREKVHSYIGPDEVARAQRLADEGMPIIWIAEDIHRGPKSVTHHIHRPEGADLEWLAAWQYIQRHPRMLELHHEFAPPTYRARIAA